MIFFMNRGFLLSCCSAWALLTVNAVASPSKGLSFADAVELAMREAPALAATMAMADAQRNAAIPAAELPDPKLTLGLQNIPIEGADRYTYDQDPMSMRSIGIMQEIPNQSRRNARAKAAQGLVELADAQTRITRLTVQRETAVAWIARATAERQLAHIDTLVSENRLLDAAVRARLAGGSSPAAEIVAPRQEAATIEERRDTLRARREQAIAALRRWIGAVADAPLRGDSPDWPLSHESLLHKLHHHPELAAFDPRKEVLDAEINEAQAAKRPDWSFELAYQQRGPQFGDMASAQLRFDLPLFPGSRQDPKIASKQAERTALDAEREAALRDHAAALEIEWAEYARLTSALKRQREVLLPLAEEKAALALSDWRGGRGSLSDAIAARSQRIDADLRAIEIDGERRQMAARLYYAYEHAGDQP